MEPPAVLIVDDDPSHLRIYGWIIQTAGYHSLSALVTRDCVDLPDESVALVLLDYHLNGRMSAVDVARLVKVRFPGAPILVLSDALVMPEDIAPVVNGFVRKGDPARLVETVRQLLGGAR
jgi:CheY-like chemotaxis protein